MNNIAPIVLFVYNRPFHASTTIDALQKNNFASDTELIIFSDGPKNSDAVKGVEQTRKLISEIKGFKTLTIYKSKYNKGLARSIIEGVGLTLEKYDRVIVLEDDLKTSPHFIQFMNEALETYERDEEVISIHGYCYPTSNPLPDSFFLKGADCWGWATWADSWKLFESDGRKLLNEIKKRGLIREFNFNKNAGYTQMLADQVLGKNDSWAVRWYASAFLKNKLTLYPGVSFVRNIGHDNFGTHCVATDVFNTTLNTDFKNLKRIKIAESQSARKEFEDFFRRIKKKKNILERVKGRLNRLLV